MKYDHTRPTRLTHRFSTILLQNNMKSDRPMRLVWVATVRRATIREFLHRSKGYATRYRRQTEEAVSPPAHLRSRLFPHPWSCVRDQSRGYRVTVWLRASGQKSTVFNKVQNDPQNGWALTHLVSARMLTSVWQQELLSIARCRLSQSTWTLTVSTTVTWDNRPEYGPHPMGWMSSFNHTWMKSHLSV